MDYIVKICINCKTPKQHSARGKMCIDCKAAYDKAYVELNKEKLRVSGQEYRNRSKERKKEYDKRFRVENKDKILGDKINRKLSGKSYEEARRSMLKAKYNISIEDYDNLVKLQDGKCKICKTTKYPGKGKCLHVDHDHQTGEIRGLLCTKCNLGLGHFEDNIEYLTKAIEYLNSNK